MITASDFLQSKYDTDLYSFQDNIEHLKEYAELAIKADRINLLNHVKAWVDTNGEWTTSAVEAKVNKNSIINAPNIELL